jgi:hypothetical protein
MKILRLATLTVLFNSGGGAGSGFSCIGAEAEHAEAVD